ncbi:MAG TPA: AraC family transcriptional regulator [Opitutaceae bacterium]|nr:AraC family transcriptional regulator [Opitutaceae bacterium]
MPAAPDFIYLPVSGADVSREIYVTSAGRLVYGPGQAYPCVGHPDEYKFNWQRGRVLADFALVLLEAGAGEFEDRSLGRVRWKAGELLLLPPGVWHRYRPGREEGWTESWLCVNGDYLHRLRDKGGFPPGAVIRQLRDPRVYGRAMARIRGESMRGNSLRLAAAALECIALAVESEELRHRGFTKTGSGDDLLDRALNYIWLNSHRSLTAGSLAEAMGQTRRTLERRFARFHRRSIAEEIRWCRVNRAKLLLSESRMSLKEVGYAAGFGGSKRLRRALRGELSRGDGVRRMRPRAGEDGVATARPA